MITRLSLPQKDIPGKERRQKYLEKMRQIYEYQFNFEIYFLRFLLFYALF